MTAIPAQPPPLAHRALSSTIARKAPRLLAKLIEVREELYQLCQAHLHAEYDGGVLIDAMMHAKRAEAVLCEAIERHQSPARKGA
jgi:hypothetical protein